MNKSVDVPAQHVIASATLFNARVALGTVFRIGTDIIRRFRIVRALLQPLFNRGALGWCMKLEATHETARGVT